MLIAVNTRLLLPEKLEGIGWFTHGTLSRLVKAHPEHRFVFLFDRPFDRRFIYADNVRGEVVWPPTRHPLLYRLWFEHRLPAVLRRLKADLFLSPDGFLSTRVPDSLPQVAVMHDLNFEHYPQDLPPAYSRYYRTWFPRFAQKAARIITVSGYSKQDIVERYGVPADRIDVAYNGVGEVFTPLSAAERATARQRFTGGAPYIVCVGSLHPRKNVARLLEAFDRVAEHDPQVKLLIVGARMFKDAQMERVLGAMRHRERAVFAGRLAHADLRLALGGAELLAYVSYFEGFGIPVAEAMRCGVPVVAANATSLPEVAGDAALYCDPFNVEDIARALRTMLGDAPLRQRAIAAGLERAQRYDWERTAEAVWATLERVMPRR
ncbi:MAG: glycosyltransferase family 1 protein [Flavobacteriales bacterium]